MNEIFKVVFTVVGAIYVLFLPGLALSFVFFRRSAIDIIERIALSFALSIAVVPLLAFYLNILGIELTRLNVILEVLLVIVLSGLAVFVRNRYTKTPHASQKEANSLHISKSEPATHAAELSYRHPTKQPLPVKLKPKPKRWQQ